MRGVAGRSAADRCWAGANSSRCLLRLLHVPRGHVLGPAWGVPDANAWTMRPSPCIEAHPLASVSTTSLDQVDTRAGAATPSSNTRPARDLTRRIKTTRSAGELAHLWGYQQARFNHIHVAASLSQLYRLAGQHNPGAQSGHVHDLVQQLLEHAQSLPSIGPRELATILWAVAHLGTAGDPAVISSFSSRVLAQLASCNSQDIGMTVWALARLGHNPGHAWLDTVAAHLQTRMHQLDAQAMVNLIWALKVLDFQPTSGWLTTFTHHLHHHLPTLTPQGHANSLWALAGMGQPCSPVWSHSLSSRLMSDLDSFSPQELSMLMYALGQAAVSSRSLPGQPHPRTILPLEVLEHASQAAAARMCDLTCDQACSLLWGMAHLGYHPGQHVLHVFFQHTQPILHTAGASTLGAMALTLQRLSHLGPTQHQAAQTHQQRHAPATQQHSHQHEQEPSGVGHEGSDFQTSNAPQLGASLVPDTWSEAFMTATLQQLPFMDIKTQAMCAYSSSVLGVVPSTAWLHRFHTSTQPALEAGAVPPVELMCMAVALARWRAVPPAVWTYEFMQAFHHSLDEHDSRPALSSRTLLALTHLKVCPEPDTVQRIKQQCETQASLVSSRELQMLARAALRAPHLDLGWVQAMISSHA